MTFKNNFFYSVVTCGVFFLLQNDDGEEIAKSREISEIAEAISGDHDIMGAYEEDQIDLNELSPFTRDELKGAIDDLRFTENFSNEYSEYSED
jgi:hypothetical protein